MTGHASFASTQRGGERPPATKATGLCTPSPKKKNTGRVLPGSLLVLPVRGLPAVRALALGRFDGAGPGPACCACAGAAGGCRWCRCSLCVVLRRPWQPRWRWCRWRGPALPRSPGASRVAAGSPASRVATGAPARLAGRGHWCGACGGLSLLFLPASPAHRDSTGPGNQSNGPPQPSPKKENTGEACGDPLPPLPVLPLLLLAARFCRSSTQAATEATGFPRPLQEGV